MRHLLYVTLLAACELQPAPKKQPAPVAPAEASKPVDSAPMPPPPPPPAAAAGSGAKIEISPECLQVGARFAQVLIDGAKDPGQKSIYEQERANMTRKTGEACTVQAWSEAARKCYLGAKTAAAINACEQKFVARRPPPSPAPPNEAPDIVRDAKPARPQAPKPAPR